MNNIITVDGPSAVGKGTLAIQLAKTLGYDYLDSGAIYRTVAFFLIQESISLKTLLINPSILLNLNIFTSIKNNTLQIILDNIDISQKIRSEKIASLASNIASIKTIREVLLIIQKNIYWKTGLIADGRDMGSHVFPNAKVKFFLNASNKVRAKRRFLELKNNINYNIEELTNFMNKRDERDKNRKFSPMQPASDAIILNNDNLSIKDTFNLAMSHIIRLKG